VKIITIPNDNDPVMNSERSRIVPWAPTNGWVYTGYNNESDHIAQIRRAGGGSNLETLDFDCHGNPTVFDHTYLASARAFGLNLSRSSGFSPNTAVYLDACNTGLTSSFGGPIAQEVANGARCTVYGTKGYMTGTFAENNEQCYATTNGLPAYPGSQDASGRNVWIAFPPGALAKTEGMPAFPSITVRSDDDRTRGVAGLVETALETEPVEFPRLRMAADVTINYIRPADVLILDVYANGGLIKDRMSDLCWRMPTRNLEEFQAALRQSLMSE
jgi:hypothetical protein